MNWNALLKSEIEATYKAADGLMAMADVRRSIGSRSRSTPHTCTAWAELW